MQFKSLIVAALAVAVAAERVPYQLSRKSVSLVALAARQEPGYQPEQTFCGAGDTCAEACGTGFEQCASTDGLSHCYDQGSGETCCQDVNGNACEAGYYCAVDTNAETWCCPDGMSASECAAEYSVTGGLSSQIPSATTPSGPLSTGPSVTGASGNGTATVTNGSSGPTATSDEEPIVSTAAAGSLAASGAFAAAVGIAAAFL